MKLFIVISSALLIIQTLYAQDEVISDSSWMKYKSGDHEMLIMPTAYTMESGSGYFSDYEILFLNFTFAPSSRTHIGTFFLFPVTADFLESITFGIKQNYFRSQYVQGALWGSFTVKNSFYTIGNVFSFGKKDKTSFHAGFGYAGENENNVFLILLGTRFSFSEKVSGMIEYTNAKELVEQNFNGLITFGIRFRTESSSWELAGIRPLESTGELLFIPLLKASFYF
jgi:hypothetical protein